jgi:hypothetical protein
MLWKRICLALTLVLSLAGSACDDSGPDGVVSCDFNSNGMHFFCEELPASYRSQLQQVCEQLANQSGGTEMPSMSFAEGPCSHANAIGGCQMKSSGVTMTVWYYQMNGSSSADIPTLCKSAGATYVSP